MLRVYRSLANTIGTHWEVGEGFLLARSPVVHPLVNFAFAHQLTAYSARELADAVMSPTLNVYADADCPATLELLRRNGFAESFTMHSLVSEGIGEVSATSGLDRDLDWVGTSFTDDNERGEVADFMLRQFFRHQDRGTQSIFGRALEHAVESPMATVRRRGILMAAALLTPAVTGEPVGIFNFCVDARHQKQGVGSGFLRWLQESQPGLEFAVQCSTYITDWYVNRGFSWRSTVAVYRKIDA